MLENIIKAIEGVLVLSVQGISVVAIIMYVSKLLIKLILNKDIEKYKSELAIAVESHKTELNMLARQDEIKFVKLHEERAEIIKELHSKLLNLENLLSTTIVIDLTRDEELKKLMPLQKEKLKELLIDYLKFYQSVKLYFDIDTCKQLERLNSKFSDVAGKYAFEEFEELNIDIRLLEHIYEKDIPDLIDNLENQFRSMLGV